MSDSLRPHRRQPTRLPCPSDTPGKNTGVGCHFLLQCMKVKSESEVAQSCPTLSDPMDCSLPGSSVHGIFQARVLEWGAIAFSVFISSQISTWPVLSSRIEIFAEWPHEPMWPAFRLLLGDFCGVDSPEPQTRVWVLVRNLWIALERPRQKRKNP